MPKPKFTLGGMLRLVLHLYPVRFNLSFILMGMLFFSYAIYLFEREANDEVWTYPGAMFSALVAMMCLYVAVAGVLCLLSFLSDPHGHAVFSYAIYLFEREANDEVWTYPGAMFSALAALMCLYVVVEGMLCLLSFLSVFNRELAHSEW